MNQPTTQSISTSTTPNVEVTATAMPQAPIPPPTFQSPSYESGGDMGMESSRANPLKDFFSDINLVEAAILGLGVATFLYAIYYYKFEMTMTRTGYADLNARLNKVELMTSKIASEKNANGKNSNRSNPRKRMLI